MSATNQFNAGTHAKFQTLVNDITALLPSPTVGSGTSAQTFSGFDFSESKGFKITLEVTSDGQTLIITSRSSDQGQNNAFGAVDGGPAGHYLRVPALVVQASLMP